MNLNFYQVVIKSNLKHHINYSNILLPQILYINKNFKNVIYKDINYVKNINNILEYNNLTCYIDLITTSKSMLNIYKYLKSNNKINKVFYRKILI